MTEDFNSAFEETIVNIAIENVNTRLRPMLAGIESIKSRYGKEMVDKGIGVNNAPNLGAYTPSWNALGDSWLRRKNASRGSPNYYRGLSPHTESLWEALFQMPTERLFGRTQLVASAGVTQSNGFYNPRIRRRIDTVYRDTGGRFARASDAGKKNLRIKVDPFPTISGTNGASIIDQLPIAGDQKKKLAYNDAARPLALNFTQWYFENKIKTYIKGYLAREL